MVTEADIIGLDHGYYNTKDNLRNIFKSAYSRTNPTLTNKYKIVINGDTFYFGFGTPTADTDKCNSIVNEVSTLSILAMRGARENFIVAGLPIGQYLNMKDKFAESIMQYNNRNVIYQDRMFTPNIKDVTIFAQGVGALVGIGLDDGRYIVFDVGSYTINVVLVQIKNGIPNILKYDTWFDGILTLYNKVIAEVNRRYTLSLDISYAEDILNKGLNVRGEEQDLNYLKPIIRDYLEGVFSKFKPNYPFDICPILFCGGGAILLGNILSSCFTNSMILPDTQFANAIGYYNFGLQKYGNYVERSGRYA